jgi:peptide subunit release factor 1 (eRF1)
VPAGIAGKIAGTVEGARHEPAAAFVARAVELLGHSQQQRQAEGVDTLLTEAAKGRRAVAGLDGTLDAINRGAVRRFYVAKSFESSGHACAGCGALARGDGPQCRLCDSPTTRVDLAHAMSDRVLAAGGRVEVIDGHTGLARVGGVAALLRYPL